MTSTAEPRPSARGLLRHAARATALAVLGRPPLDRATRLLPPAHREAIRLHRQIVTTLEDLLTPESNCIDIGAYAGDYLRVMVRRAPRGRHVAWEPLPYRARSLRRRFPSVDVHACALAAEAGVATFAHMRARPTFSGLRVRADQRGEAVEEFQVEVETLDGALPPDLVPHIVKIDVEGGLVPVLLGGRRVLARHRPAIVFEYGNVAADTYGTSFRDVYRLITSEFGMVIRDLEGNGPFSEAEFAAIEDRSDFVALPR